MAVNLENLETFYDGLAMKLAMEPKNLVMHGLKAAVEHNKPGTDINTAAAGWVAKGYLAQTDADAITALVTARDSAEPEPEEPTEPEPTEPGEGEGE